MRYRLDERGTIAVLAVVIILPLMLFITGIAGYAGALTERGRLQRALKVAASAAVAQVDPASIVAGAPTIDAARARQAFDAAFPRAGRLTVGWGPQAGEEWLAGPVELERFTVYQAADRGYPNPLGETIPGPSVYAQVAAPVWLRLLGAPATAITVRAAVMQATPAYDVGGGGWR